MKELELYGPMASWLHSYLLGKYKKEQVIVEDTHNDRLDRALLRHGINNDVATGIDIQIDVLGIVKGRDDCKLFFIEAKKTSLTLRDLGQLWSYCKLIDPEEAFLLTSENLVSLNKLINVYKREDLLDFGNGKKIKKMKIAVWDTISNNIKFNTMVPKL